MLCNGVKERKINCQKTSDCASGSRFSGGAGGKIFPISAKNKIKIKIKIWHLIQVSNFLLPIYNNKKIDTNDTSFFHLYYAS